MDPKATFIKRFGDLVALLRADPGNDAAQELALTAAVASVATQPLEIEAGVQWSEVPDELSLKGRLLARQVDCLHVAAGAEPHELLALARALAHDLTPVPSSASVQVEFVPLLAPSPPEPPDGGGNGGTSASLDRRRSTERRHDPDRRRPGRSRWLGFDRRQRGERRMSGERRIHLVKDDRALVAKLQDKLAQATRALDWEGVLLAAAGLCRMIPRLPSAERRTFAIQVRRTITRRAVEALVDLAEREPSCRPVATEVLRWLGLDAAEAMIDRLRQGELLGVRVYFYEVVGGMPEAYPLVTPLLRSTHPHEIRHGAALLGRLGIGEGVEVLEPLLQHRDELVRAAVVQALGEIHAGPASDGLRRALHHPSAKTRSAAAQAISNWRDGVLAVLLVGALDSERDTDAWRAIVGALGRVGTPAACSALANVALTRRSLLRRQGYTTGQRLAAVAALGVTESSLARTTLERLSRDAVGVVRYAAERVLRAETQRAG
jgi:HEAT repeat protein